MTKSFEEFEVHKKAVLLTKQVFKLLNNSSLEKEFGFKDQIKRAVISITNNIAEGSEYNNNKQFIRYLKIAKGSCAEVRNMLLLAKELEFCTENELWRIVAALEYKARRARNETRRVPGQTT